MCQDRHIRSYIRLHVCCLVGLVLWSTACSDSTSSSGEATAQDSGVQEANFGPDGDGLTDSSIQDSAIQDTTPIDTTPSTPEDTGGGGEVFLEDGFSRPMVDTDDTDDAEALPGVTVEGSQDCLGYVLETQSTLFTLKVDNFFITYTIRNTCNRPLRMRVEHESDMFPVGIQKNGEPWIFLPDCPGTGRSVERSFNPNEGWRRGWMWRADDHDARLARCGVTFEPDASYAIVGYGLTEVPSTGSNVWSELYPLTEPIPITLVTPSE